MDLSSSTVARLQSDIEEIFGFGLTSSKDVFINNELDLSKIDVYGFGKLFYVNRGEDMVSAVFLSCFVFT